MSNECKFSKLTVKQYQLELIRRGALTTGQKQDLIERYYYHLLYIDIALEKTSSPAKVSSYLPFDKPFTSRTSKFINSAD